MDREFIEDTVIGTVKTIARSIDENNSIWTERVVSLFETVVRNFSDSEFSDIFETQDDNVVVINTSRFRDIFEFENLVRFSENNDDIQRYLETLPGYESGPRHNLEAASMQHEILKRQMDVILDKLND